MRQPYFEAMRAIFEQVYAGNAWRYGSGEGSLAMHTRGYVRFLQRFLRERRIASVLDLGCGDWQVGRRIDWSGIDYLGCDVVPALVRENRRRFGAPGIRFAELDGLRDPLPQADLLVVKDVLQHWSNAEILEFLPRLGEFRCALVTNCAGTRDAAVNLDARTGGYRAIDLARPPFSLAATEVYSFENWRNPLARLFLRPRWRKKVLLVESPAARSPASVRR